MTRPPDIRVLKREHAELGIGRQIHTILWRVVRAIAPSYPPTIYSSAGAWDVGTLEELLHEWVAERLLRGDLSMMIESSATTKSLRAQLATSLRQMIINRRRRDSAGNLYKRSLEKLKRDDRFEQIGTGSAHLAGWRLAGGSTEPSPLTLAELVRRAHELDDDALEVVRYGPHSLKSSPILRDRKLGDFLEHLLMRAEGTLTMSRIAEVTQRRFALVRESDRELDHQLSDTELIDLHVELEAQADSVVRALDSEEVEALRALAEHDWQKRVASENTGIPVQRLELAIGEITHLVAEYAESEDEASAVFARILEKVFLKE